MVGCGLRPFDERQRPVQASVANHDTTSGRIAVEAAEREGDRRIAAMNIRQESFGCVRGVRRQREVGGKRAQQGSGA
jgi:hypothetical protein